MGGQMTGRSRVTIRLAAVQAQSLPGQIEASLGHAAGSRSFPGYYELPISSPDGSCEAVLLVNADRSLIPQSQLKQVYDVLDTAYCRGVPS